MLANNEKVISDLDVAVAAGGVLTAYKRHFDVKAKDGFVDLQFKPSKGDAIVSAIEVE